MSCGHRLAQRMRMLATATTSPQTHWYLGMVHMRKLESSILLVVQGPWKLNTHDHQNHEVWNGTDDIMLQTGPKLEEWNTVIAAGFVILRIASKRTQWVVVMEVTWHKFWGPTANLCIVLVISRFFCGNTECCKFSDCVLAKQSQHRIFGYVGSTWWPSKSIRFQCNFICYLISNLWFLVAHGI